VRPHHTSLVGPNKQPRGGAELIDHRPLPRPARAVPRCLSTAEPESPTGLCRSVRRQYYDGDIWCLTRSGRPEATAGCVCVCVCVCGSGAVALTDHRMMENRQRASSLGATYELYEYLHFLLPVPLWTLVVSAVTGEATGSATPLPTCLYCYSCDLPKSKKVVFPEPCGSTGWRWTSFSVALARKSRDHA